MLRGDTWFRSGSQKGILKEVPLTPKAEHRKGWWAIFPFHSVF